MKKLLIVMASLSVFLFANEFSNNIDLECDRAFQSYKEKDFQTSYKIYSKIYLSKLSDVKINFYLGRSAYEVGNYEIALVAYQRVEMLDPTNLRNKLEMARTYYMLKMYENAQIAFEEVLDNPNIPQNVRTNIEIYLSKVKKVQRKSFTYATLNVDFLYDSNVNYGSLDSLYNVGTGMLPIKEQSDTAFQLYGNIANIYDIGSKNGFAIKNALTLYLKDYSDLNDYNVQYISYTPSLIYKERKYLAEFVVGYDILKLGSIEYLRSMSATPRFEYSHKDVLRSMAYFKYQKKDYTQRAQYDLNAEHYELGYSLQSILSPRSYIQLNLKGLKEKKEHGTRTDVDYDEYRVSLAYANQFSVVYGMELFGEYRKRGYEDFSNIFYSTRDDDSISAVASINARILKTLRVHLKGGYDRVESNQKKFSYDKYTITLGINKAF